MMQAGEHEGDPLIDEVRARRRALLESCGNDLNRLLERIEQLQRQHPEKLVDRRSAREPTGPGRRQ